MLDPTVISIADPVSRAGHPARWRGAGLAAALAAVATLVFAVPPVGARPGPEGFSELVKKVQPAVVNVSTTQAAPRAGQRSPQARPMFPPGSPFEEFFRRFFEDGLPGDGDGPAPRDRGEGVSALGSGFIVDPTGYVVTNHHVVGEATKIAVTLTDGRKFDARLVGRDDKTDLALLKIESARPLPFVRFGDSDKAEVGDWIVAVGNPFGLGGSVTAGIISARGREIQQGPFDDFLQIDAAINRGNSGGPSFNLDGEVVGINTAIFSPNGGSVGIGFAIPSNVARPVIEELRSQGSVRRGLLGVNIQPVTPDIADSLGLKTGERGALVAGVTEGSPAARAGVRQGDVILSVNGRPVERFRDLPRMIAAARPGETVTLEVWREGGARTLSATLDEMSGSRRAAAEPAGRERPGRTPEGETTRTLGLSLSALTPELRQRHQVAAGVTGVVVTAVRPDSDAAAQGLRPGDVIVKAGDTPVRRPADVVKAVQDQTKAERRAVLLMIHRGGSERFVALPVGAG